MTPKLIVTGLSRSGTRYTARVLQQLGVNATHEGIYRFRRLWDQVEIRPNGAEAEISWLAAPFLSTLDPGTKILIQFREPVAVLNSIASQIGRPAWAQPERYLDPGQWVETIIGEAPTNDPRDQALHFYVGWLGLLRNALQQRRVKQLGRVEHLSPNRLAFLLGWAGLRDTGPVGGTLYAETIDQAAAALAAVPNNENNRGAIRQFFTELPREALLAYREFLQ